MDEPRRHGRELTDAEVLSMHLDPHGLGEVRRVGIDPAADGAEPVIIYESSKRDDPALMSSWRPVGQVRMPQVKVPEVTTPVVHLPPTPIVNPAAGERLARALERMAERLREVKIEPGSGMDRVVKTLKRRMDEVETPDPRERALRAKAARQNHGPVGKRRKR